MKNGDIKFQDKKFDVNWKNYQSTGKRHLVNILIRDHFSNCFYAEIHAIDLVPSIGDFLFNAWREKDHFEFCGIPKNLILGRHIIQQFPEIENLRVNANLNVELAQNGFATGIRSVRDWENNIRYYSSFRNLKSLDDFQDNVEIICRALNLSESGKTEANLKKWMNNAPRGTVINDKQVFESLFEQTKDKGNTIESKL
ncbi:hypothetical protein [Flavobacterium cerinum]|uniref:Uncharacterized protein n=1 Tax=Flavobacterium cerinum TaxID=2502784 RepID=A0ABY5IMY2_9FLAO|nr:hypothetical protein [Flavobacterium cerinum]UUC44187.1 hypothetical protein NOX80_11135 [Flavobacterium cerinum]